MVCHVDSSISTKVWDKARDEFVTPGFAVGLATDCATGSGINHKWFTDLVGLRFDDHYNVACQNLDFFTPKMPFLSYFNVLS